MSKLANRVAAPACPDCGESKTTCVGEIPSTRRFAGQWLAEPLSGGSLWRCASCLLAFRWPVLDKSALDRLYAAGADDTWKTPVGQRRDWLIAKHWLKLNLLPQASVLDIGCFDGGFLGLLGESYVRLGIEIHAGARQRAEARGIKMLAADFAALEQHAQPADCITAFDIIEHVHRPALFLEQCRNLMKPGGYIVISTGNADAASFRLMGAGYWYCTILEHLSFISPAWCSQTADELGLRVVSQQRFSHGNGSRLQASSESLKNLCYRVAPRLYARLRGSALESHPPSWITARDHFITLLQKR